MLPTESNHKLLKKVWKQIDLNNIYKEKEKFECKFNMWKIELKKNSYETKTSVLLYC